jgi:hypothetical protein
MWLEILSLNRIFNGIQAQDSVLMYCYRLTSQILHYSCVRVCMAVHSTEGCMNDRVFVQCGYTTHSSVNGGGGGKATVFAITPTIDTTDPIDQDL